MRTLAHSRLDLADVQRNALLYRNLLSFLYSKPSTQNPMPSVAPVFQHREPRVRRFPPVVLNRPPKLEPVAVNTGHPQPAHSPEPAEPVVPATPATAPTEPAAPVEPNQTDTAALS